MLEGAPRYVSGFARGQSALGTRCSDEATSIGYTWVRARVAELADALDLGSSVFDVWVRVPSRAQLPVPGRPREAAVDRLRS